MAKDIVPIELGLPEGDVTTLWAPSWREDNDDWEAFLGLDEDLYAFGSTAQLLALVRRRRAGSAGPPSWKSSGVGCPSFRAATRTATWWRPQLGEGPTESSVDEIDQSFAIAR